jgi:hypothetical protein
MLTVPAWVLAIVSPQNQTKLFVVLFSTAPSCRVVFPQKVPKTASETPAITLAIGKERKKRMTPG